MARRVPLAAALVAVALQAVLLVPAPARAAPHVRSLGQPCASECATPLAPLSNTSSVGSGGSVSQSLAATVAAFVDAATSPTTAPGAVPTSPWNGLLSGEMEAAYASVRAAAAAWHNGALPAAVAATAAVFTAVDDRSGALFFLNDRAKLLNQAYMDADPGTDAASRINETFTSEAQAVMRTVAAATTAMTSASRQFTTFVADHMLHSAQLCNTVQALCSGQVDANITKANATLQSALYNETCCASGAAGDACREHWRSVGSAAQAGVDLGLRQRSWCASQDASFGRVHEAVTHAAGAGGLSDVSTFLGYIAADCGEVAPAIGDIRLGFFGTAGIEAAAAEANMTAGFAYNWHTGACARLCT